MQPPCFGRSETSVRRCVVQRQQVVVGDGAFAIQRQNVENMRPILRQVAATTQAGAGVYAAGGNDKISRQKLDCDFGAVRCDDNHPNKQ